MGGLARATADDPIFAVVTDHRAKLETKIGLLDYKRSAV
jgi:hypothetical protein